MSITDILRIAAFILGAILLFSGLGDSNLIKIGVGAVLVVLGVIPTAVQAVLNVDVGLGD